MKYFYFILLLSLARPLTAQTSDSLAWLYKKLNLNEDSIRADLVATKILPYDQQSEIYIIPHITEYDCEMECWTADIYIVQVSRKDKEINASAIIQNGIISDAIKPYKIWVDTAPYLLKDDMRAFAVRIKSSNNSRAASYDGEEFWLLHKEATNLERILEVTSKKSIAYGGGDCENTEIHNQYSTFVIDKSRLTNGYFNILEKVHYEHYFLTVDCEEGTKEKAIYTNVFQLENGLYEPLEQRKEGW